MNREEAARILHPDTQPQEQLKFTYKTWVERFDEACIIGAEALRGPWVKTSDRAPTMEDADAWDLVFATHRAFGGEPYKVRYRVVANNPSDHVWWMPIPPLPEVEE